MTKEELKQEAEAEADKVIIGSGMDRASVIHLKHLLVTMYIQGAEPREKRIADLEKENAELKKEVEKHKWNDIFLEDCAGYDKKIAEEYTTLQERIKQLEEENAELKNALKGKVCKCIIYLNFKDLEDQLSKAKEMIKKLKALYFSPVVTKDDVKRQDEILAEAEQFISEVEK